ncbi:hypothetical protein V1505DRAFT_367825 [Lipomyces doorenjongii]
MDIQTRSAPSDPYKLFQFGMTRVHHVFETAFYRILKLLDDPPRQDLSNFLGYCEVWCVGLIDHHDAEEIVMFPELQKKVDFAEEIEDHKKIHDFLVKFLDQIRCALKDQDSFDPAGMIQTLKDVESTLISHLRQEIIDLAPARLEVFSEKEIMEIMDTAEKYAISHCQMVFIPFFRSHTPPEYKFFPSLPGPFRNILLPFLAIRYRGYWKYSPYSVI